MKKQLLSTSAIALGIAMAAPASAQDWNMDWGGYQRAGVGYADVSGTLATGMDLDGIDVFQSGEIHFTPSVTLDNGLTFGVNIQLEGATSGDTIDETYITISGDNLGTITIGSENSEGYRMSVGAPEATLMFINSPSVSAFIPFSAALTAGNQFRTAMISTYTEVGGNNDSQRISYRTPSFNGFQVGVSYARDTSQEFSSGIDTNAAGVLSDIFDVAVAYSATVGTADVALSARWGTGDVAGAAPVGGTAETWGLGASVGFNGITIGGSYGENDNPGTVNDVNGWSLGATFDAPGPWTFGLSTYQGESDAPGSQEEYTAYKLGASRSLGTGVSWDIYVVDVEAKNTAGADVDGTAVGTTINLSF
ncbi:hypothetical protein PEL8287_01809 [Roseovarius litorisediminis]|uniref:Porin domain-containing protein n=1 Tax=Roseovarius litorisediminis TaxID=1312363 RepID=A0A1Y5SCH4_9RHOB|nr:porin [Roseovarius litorisediminis]SLN37594.1 hypothetical protein PEL8287_01809 [Roseovarius litorisediminis]